MTYVINDEAVCRTAPATPGLLNEGLLANVVMVVNFVVLVVVVLHQGVGDGSVYGKINRTIADLGYG